MKRAKLISAEREPISINLEASSDADIGAAVWNLLSVWISIESTQCCDLGLACHASEVPDNANRTG